MRLPVALILAVAPLLALPSIAQAHSSLVASTPASGAVVEEAPAEIVMRFSDPVTVPDGVVSVRDLAGGEHVVEGVRVEGRTVTVPLDGDGSGAGARGTRVVAWNAISDHGTAISGSFAFHVGEPTAAAAVGDGSARGELLDLFRALALAGLGGGIVAALALAVRERRSAAAIDAAPRDAAARAALAGVLVVAAVGGIAGWLASGGERVEVQAWLLAAGAVAAVVALAAPRLPISRARLLAGPGVALACAVLLVGVASAEPRAGQAATTVEQVVSLGEDAEATVLVDPAVAGSTDVAVTVRGMQLGTAAYARLRHAPADGSMGWFETELERADPGSDRFTADDVTFPVSGRWDMELAVGADSSSSSLARFDLDVQPNPELEPDP